MSLTSRERPSRKSLGLASDIPSPLHIVKRMKTVEFHSNTKRETSSGSIDYGPGRPLQVRKRRQRSESAKDITSNAYIYQDQVFKAEPEFGNQDVTPKPPTACPSTRRPPGSEAVRRWFSKTRNSSSGSSGTTCRRYNLRSGSTASNASSCGQSSSLGYLEGTSTLDSSESFSPVQTKGPFSGAPLHNWHTIDCHLLTPQISITSEVRASQGATTTVWASIEVSGQLSRPCYPTQHRPIDDRLHMPNPLRPGSVSRFGHLYDLEVEVLPVGKTNIIEVIQDHKDR